MDALEHLALNFSAENTMVGYCLGEHIIVDPLTS
jgi:hypothetical protein